MSIKRVVLGIGGAGAITVGGWFGLSKKQEHDHYKTKITGLRRTAKKVNGYLSSNPQYKEMELGDPEHGIWDKNLTTSVLKIGMGWEKIETRYFRKKPRKAKRIWGTSVSRKQRRMLKMQKKKLKN